MKSISRSSCLLFVFCLPAIALGNEEPLKVPKLSSITVPEDTKLSAVATHRETGITCPMAITFDDQGNVYLAESHRLGRGVADTRDYPDWIMDDLASLHNVNRRELHTRWSEILSVRDLVVVSDQVVFLKDKNDDGKFEKALVYSDGYKDVIDGPASAIYYYEGSIYLGCIPKVVMLRDADDDGKAEESTVINKGMGVKISLADHGIRGFQMGPDGRIYGVIGDRGLNIITQENITYSLPNQGAAFRFEIDGSNFEIFHTGLRNPGDIAFDEEGNAFCVDGNIDLSKPGRVIQLLFGGDSGWQIENLAMHTFYTKLGYPSRPMSAWISEQMGETAQPDQPAYMLPAIGHLGRGQGGLAYFPGTGNLNDLTGRFVSSENLGSPADSGVWSFRLEADGAGNKLAETSRYISGVCATDVAFSPDGRLFISDFISGWKSHEGGRLLALTSDEKPNADSLSTKKQLSDGFEKRTSSELATLLAHPDFRVRLRAQLALTRKPDALAQFSEALLSSREHSQRHAIWGIGILARRGAAPLPSAESSEIPTAQMMEDAKKKLVNLIETGNDHFKIHALRALADTDHSGAELPLSALLVSPSPRVRYEAAMLIGKRKLLPYYGMVCDMLRENDNKDRTLRHAGIFALQHMSDDPKMISALNGDESPAVRLAATVALRRMQSIEVAAFLEDKDISVVNEAIRAIADTPIAEARPALAKVMDRLDQLEVSALMRKRLLENSYQLGTAEEALRVLTFAANPKFPEAERVQALDLIGAWSEPPAYDRVVGRVIQSKKRPDSVVIGALDQSIAPLLKVEGPISVRALALVQQYKLNLSGKE
ncbi:MAG: hypothetical protein EAZ42_01405 [Verrucomicrobia bacterium]|nr:MAG: hypothetical protein EAZ42_01405 [Verrucomicrobiota bacterium]